MNKQILLYCAKNNGGKIMHKYLAASSTQPQFLGPLPPLFSSGDIPLQWMQDSCQYIIMRWDWFFFFFLTVSWTKMLTFHCVDHTLSCPSGWSCPGSLCRHHLLLLSYFWIHLCPWSQSLHNREAWRTQMDTCLFLQWLLRLTTMLWSFPGWFLGNQTTIWWHDAYPEGDVLIWYTVILNFLSKI